MRRFSFNPRISKREPGKTPLIDIIFILLIFFLVTMSTNLGSGNSGEGRGEEQARLPVIENPNQVQGGYILIDVFDLSAGSGTKRGMVQDLRASFSRLSAELGIDSEFPEVPSEGFMVSVCGGIRYIELAEFRESSERLLRELQNGTPREELRDRARRLFIFYPEFLPAAPHPLTDRQEDELERRIASMNGLIGGDDLGIHIRMPDKMYMHFVRSAFRILERRGVDIDRVRIHAMKA